jgi:hypothetical protein
MLKVAQELASVPSLHAKFNELIGIKSLAVHELVHVIKALLSEKGLVFVGFRFLNTGQDKGRIEKNVPILKITR